MAVITAREENKVKNAMLNAVVANRKDKFDDDFISFFTINLKNMKLKREKRYSAYFTGEADGEAHCSYKATILDEPYTDYTDVRVFGVPFRDCVISRSPISKKDISSDAAVLEITKEVQKEMNRAHGHDYEILSVKRTDVRVYTEEYYESDRYVVQFKYGNKTEEISFDGENTYSLETTYTPAARKRRELKAKIVSFIVPLLLAVAGFALYVIAAMDFCNGGGILSVICAIAYGGILAFPFMALLALMRVHLKFAIECGDEISDYLFLVLETIAVAGIFALTAYLGFFLEI